MELDIQVWKQKEVNAKLEASLKEIKERRMTEIVKLLLRGEKVETTRAESVKKLKKHDTKLASAKSRVAKLEGHLGDLEARHQDELKKQQEEIFDNLFAIVDSYRCSTLYGVQLLRGPLDLWAVDLGHLYSSPKDFNVLCTSQQEMDAGRSRDAALITPVVEESEQGESSDEVGAQTVSSTRDK